MKDCKYLSTRRKTYELFVAVLIFYYHLVHSSFRTDKFWWDEPYRHRRADEKEINTTVERLTKITKEVTDSKRTQQGRIKKMGVVNAWAWKGYN